MKSVESLLNDYKKRDEERHANPLVFTGVKGKDVYNIAAPFTLDGKTYLAGRVEARKSEISKVCFFKKAGPYSFEATAHHIPDFQDPHVTFMDEELLVGGTEIEHQHHTITSWRTVYHKGKSLSSLTPFLQAPFKMKDVRLHKDTRGIHAFTRPQGGEAGPGKIGYLNTDSLDSLTTYTLSKAPILHDHFPEGSWGGVNDIHTLRDGRLGILGHIATMDDEGHRHYHGMVFAFDPETKKSTDLKIVCTRKDFPEDEAKRPDLLDVVFPGGIVRNSDGTATIYAGVSDAKAYTLTIPDPFKAYEGGDGA